MTQQGLSCTLEQLGLGAEEPQGGPCSEPSAPIPVVLLAAWANDLLGNQQTSWKPCQSLARHYLVISIQPSGGNSPFSSTDSHCAVVQLLAQQDRLNQTSKIRMETRKCRSPLQAVLYCRRGAAHGFFHDGSNKRTAEALVLCWPAVPMRDQHSGLALHSAVSFSVQLLIPLFAWL